MTAAPMVAGGRDARPVPAREDAPSAPAGLLRERAVEHMVGGRIVRCWDPRSCELCSPVPITGRLDPYRLRVAS